LSFWVRLLNLSTIVPGKALTNESLGAAATAHNLKNAKADYMCTSACFFIFVGGVHKSHDDRGPALLGIHRPSLKGPQEEQRNCLREARFSSEGAKEDTAGWSASLKHLKGRGLKGVRHQRGVAHLCSSTCSASFTAGAQVSLTAVPASGWLFTGWGGACSGTGSCNVTMNAANSVSATFVQLFALSVNVGGSGSVTSSPAGISCGATCSANFTIGTQVTLTASPASGWSFNGWGGACSGNGSCPVTMNSIESVTAMFSSSGGGGPSTQTFVSAALGSDSNPCTRVSPCLTFAAALAQTTAGGEIDVIDPGDFGPVTITKAITIFGNAVGGTSVAGTTPSPGTSGIVISAGSSDVINLGDLIFDGVNASGTSGVVFTSGARLRISKCVFQGFTTSGMTFSPGAGSANTTLLVVQDTAIVNNATGLLIQPTGGIAAKVAMRRLYIGSNTGEGLRFDGTGGPGAINATLADSTVSLNASNGIDAVSGPGNASVDIMRVVAASGMVRPASERISRAAAPRA
jgi:hypothetical protein